MLKRFFSLTLALMLVLSCFASCGKPAESEAGSDRVAEEGAFEDLYSKLIYEVKDQNGVITEQMYGLYRDEALSVAVGSKDVYFNAETGKVSQYVATIGLVSTERTVTFREDLNGSTYMTEIRYSSDGTATSANSQNNYTDSEGVKIKEIANQEYWSDGVTVKNLKIELYRDGELESTTIRKYDESGAMTSEEVL